ncbi:MAG: hypothetical protein JW881_01460, partial [Spirochaetales bacterium]|nr:hypothetical protein [Spirochaetales bacterium]
MSKNHRGKGIIEKYRHGRGTCPICKRTGVKIVYERDVESKKMNICKICNVGLTKKEEAKKAKQAVEEPKAAAKVEVKAEVKAEPKVE